MKNNFKLIGVGIITAIAASLCCIAPVLALLAGVSGFASAFHWIDPLRPYLIGFTILVLGFAWYQKLKPQKQMACECETDSKPKFIQSKKFLGIITLFAILMMAFPLYDGIFYPQKPEKQVVYVNQSNIETIEFSISGMTCSDCEKPVNHQILQLSGILQSTVSYDNGNAVVKFDRSQSDIDDVKKAINSTGYSVTSTKEI